MATVKLTALYVDKLSPPVAGRFDIHDTKVPGLILRVTPAGAKTYSFRYTFRNRTNRLTLGQHPGMSLDLARERAWDARAAIQRGEDPVQHKKDAEREARENTFKGCVDDFIEKYAKPNVRHWEDVKSAFDRQAVPRFGGLPVKEIKRRDIVDLLDDVAKETPYGSNHLRAYLSKFFNWLIEREVVDANPVTGIAPRQKYEARNRVLDDREVVALWKATGRLGVPFGPAVRLLLLTGVRRDEAGCLRWDELDLAGGWANLPASRMKGRRDFKVPLSTSAKAIIEGQPKLGPYVFTTTGKTPISGWGNAKDTLDTLMAEELGQPAPYWRFHDLRRTVASGLASLGYSLQVIKRVLGHAPASSDVTSVVYNWHAYDDEAMEAVQKWANHIARLVAGLHIVPEKPVA